MILLSRTTATWITLAMLFILGACRNDTPTATNTPPPSPSVSAVPIETPMVTPTLTPRSLDYSFLTLPVIDAFLTDEAFVAGVKSRLALTSEEVRKLHTAARQETAKLRETETDAYTFSTAEAHEQAMRTLQDVLGEARAREFAGFVFERWGEEREVASAAPAPSGAPAASPTPSKNALPMEANHIPSDTRIVVNSPAYRMDVFRNGQLIKTYKIGIGYPEFPIPIALRKATTIIFNPTWTPPDEPWVESPSSKVKVGETVTAGSALNPLGLIKIPIGLPSLIHGGKPPAKIGAFASHGCVALTDPQVQDFAKLLADVSGAQLSVEQLTQYAKNRTETKNVKLPQPIPVELRYETIVVEDGKLHIYRDVYDRNTNTEAELERVLQTYGVSLNDLTNTERQRVQEALKLLARDTTGKANNVADKASPEPSPKDRKENNAAEQRKLTRTIKGAKEIVIEIAALKGRGYPVPVDLSTGASTKLAVPKTSKKK